MIARMILTANQQFAARQHGGYQKVIEKALNARWGRVAKACWEEAGTPLQAFINHGNWVVQCDDCPAPSTAFAEPGMGFICINCQNVMNGGFARPVAFPAERAAIEALLLERPFPQNRNWFPGETPEQLQMENDEHLGEEEN